MVTGINSEYYNNFYNKYNSYNNTAAQTPYLINNTGIYPTQPAPQQNGQVNKYDANDGKISFGKKIGNLLKGAAKFFTGMVCDENGNFSLGQCLKTVAMGAGIAAATLLIPGAGAVISLGFLGLGGLHVAKGAYHAATATTDAEAEEAWQNIGSGVVETGLAYVGAKKTGAFKKAGKAIDSVKTSFTDLKEAYQSGGFDGLKAEAGLQKAKVVNFGKNIKDQTVTNWKKALVDKDARYKNVEDAYKERMKDADPTKKAKLQSELDAYKQGYETVKTETDFSKASEALQELKENMQTAQEAARKPGATDAQKAAYKEAKIKYNAARTTLDTRVNAGEFRHELADGKLDPVVEKTLNDNVTAAKTQLDAAKKAYDGTDSSKTVLKEAQKAYDQALAEQKANIGQTERTFRAKAAISDGFRYPNAQFLTLVGAGRGYNEVA